MTKRKLSLTDNRRNVRSEDVTKPNVIGAGDGKAKNDTGNVVARTDRNWKWRCRSNNAISALRNRVFTGFVLQKEKKGKVGGAQ